MKLLIDTNIFLEVLLEQVQANDAQALLATVEAHEFFISDFSLHSIGLLLFRRKQFPVFRDFLEDVVSHARMTVILLSASDLESVVQSAQKHNLIWEN